MQGAHKPPKKRPRQLEEGELRTSATEQRTPALPTLPASSDQVHATDEQPIYPADYRSRKAAMQHDPRDAGRGADVDLRSQKQKEQKEKRRLGRPGNVVFYKDPESGFVVMTRPLLTVECGRKPDGHSQGGRPASTPWPTVRPLLEEGLAEELHVECLAPLNDVLPTLCDAHARSTEPVNRKEFERVVYASIEKQRALPRNARLSPAAFCEMLLRGRGEELHAVYLAGAPRSCEGL